MAPNSSPPSETNAWKPTSIFSRMGGAPLRRGLLRARRGLTIADGQPGGSHDRAPAARGVRLDPRHALDRRVSGDPDEAAPAVAGERNLDGAVPRRGGRVVR